MFSLLSVAVPSYVKHAVCVEMMRDLNLRYLLRSTFVPHTPIPFMLHPRSMIYLKGLYRQILSDSSVEPGVKTCVTLSSFVRLLSETTSFTKARYDTRSCLASVRRQARARGDQQSSASGPLAALTPAGLTCQDEAVHAVCPGVSPGEVRGRLPSEGPGLRVSVQLQQSPHRLRVAPAGSKVQR